MTEPIWNLDEWEPDERPLANDPSRWLDSQTQLAATRERIEQIFAIRDDSHDQTALAAEYRTLIDRETVLLRAIQRPLCR